MFLNINILKRLMRHAYKSGLVLGMTEERLYIAGSYWEMDVKKNFVPKQIIAQIYELAGVMPETGECFSATKEGNQFELESRMEINSSVFPDTAAVTKLLILDGGIACRILQDQANGTVYTCNNVFIAIADNDAVDEERGEAAIDERTVKYGPYGILWENNVARFRARRRIIDREARLLAELKMIDLTEDLETGGD